MELASPVFDRFALFFKCLLTGCEHMFYNPRERIRFPRTYTKSSSTEEPQANFAQMRHLLLAFLNDLPAWRRASGIPPEGFRDEALAKTVERQRFGVIVHFWDAGLLSVDGKRRNRGSVSQVTDSVLEGRAVFCRGPRSSLLGYRPDRRRIRAALKTDGREAMSPESLAAAGYTVIRSELVLPEHYRPFPVKVPDSVTEEATPEMLLYFEVLRPVILAVRREKERAFARRRLLKRCSTCTKRYFWAKGRQRDCDVCRTRLPSWQRWQQRKGRAPKGRGPSAEELGKVQQWRRDAVSAGEIARRVFRSRATVYRWVSKARGGSVK
jgi:hypothetical protein